MRICKNSSITPPINNGDVNNSSEGAAVARGASDNNIGEDNDQNLNQLQEADVDEEDEEPIEDAADIEFGIDVGDGDPFERGGDAPPLAAAAEAGPNEDGPTTVAGWTWSSFQRTMPIDARSPRDRHNPSITHVPTENLKRWNPTRFFCHFLPLPWVREHLLPGTNASMKAAGICLELTEDEFLKYFGILFLMSLNGQYPIKDFFLVTERKGEDEGGVKKGKKRKLRKPIRPTRKRDEFWNPPPIGKWMRRNRFKEITSHLRLTKNAAPHYRDRAWAIREMVKGFNEHMKHVFEPS